MIFIYENTGNRRTFKYAIVIQKKLGWACIKIGNPKVIDYSEGGSYLRKFYYISRCTGDTTKSGIYDKVFWERWLLNEKQTLRKSIKYITKKFEVIIISGF